MDSLPLRLLALLALVSLGSALECFVCNSHQDKSCYDMSGDSQTTFLKDCNKHYNNSTANYTLCRKLHMYMDQDFGEANPHEDRIQRDCGYIDDESLKRRGDCYYRSGYNTRTWVCSCKDDKCNGARHTAVSAVTLLVTFAVGALVRNQVIN